MFNFFKGKTNCENKQFFDVDANLDYVAQNQKSGFVSILGPKVTQTANRILILGMLNLQLETKLHVYKTKLLQGQSQAIVESEEIRLHKQHASNMQILANSLHFHVNQIDWNDLPNLE